MCHGSWWRRLCWPGGIWRYCSRRWTARHRHMPCVHRIRRVCIHACGGRIWCISLSGVCYSQACAKCRWSYGSDGWLQAYKNDSYSCGGCLLFLWAENNMANKEEIKISEKILLTIDEAALLSNIRQNRIADLFNEKTILPFCTLCWTKEISEKASVWAVPRG